MTATTSTETAAWLQMKSSRARISMLQGNGSKANGVMTQAAGGTDAPTVHIRATDFQPVVIYPEESK